MNRTLVAIALSSLLAACGGGGSSEPEPIRVEVVSKPAYTAPDISTTTVTVAPVTPRETIAPMPVPVPRAGDLVQPVAEVPRPSSSAPVAPSVPVAVETPPPDACPADWATMYPTPETALAAAPRGDFNRIVGAPRCMTQPTRTEPVTKIATWNAICQTARCMVTP